MSPWTTLTVSRSDMGSFRRLAEQLRVPQHKLFSGMVLRFSQLNREQQEQALGLVDPASPSSGDAGECDDSASAKQARTRHLPRRQRGAA